MSDNSSTGMFKTMLALKKPNKVLSMRVVNLFMCQYFPELQRHPHPAES